MRSPGTPGRSSPSPCTRSRRCSTTSSATPPRSRGSRFAIVVDEAHSSQSGDAATAVKAALRDLGLDSDSDDEGATTVTSGTDQLKAEGRGALPGREPLLLRLHRHPEGQDPRTLRHARDTEDGKAIYRPFHTYSMRQAIEEGFILDPLRNYVTYNTYWKLVNQNPDEKEVDPSKANTLLARYALTHDSTVAQHAQVIVEHFVDAHPWPARRACQVHGGHRLPAVRRADGARDQELHQGPGVRHQVPRPGRPRRLLRLSHHRR